MNLEFRTMVRHGFWLLIAVSASLLSACATPPETKVGEADKARDAAVVQSVRTEAAGERTIVTFVCSAETTCERPHALSHPGALSFAIKARPAADLPREIIIQDGPLERVLIREKGPEQTEVVIHARHEVSQTRLTTEGKDILFEVVPAASEKSEALRPGQGSGSPSPPQIVVAAVIQRPGNRTRLRIATDRKADFHVKLDGTNLLVDLEKGTINAELLKNLESEYDQGAIQRVETFYSPEERRVSLRLVLRDLVPYHISQDGKMLEIDFDAARPESPPKPKVPAKASLSPAPKPLQEAPIESPPPSPAPRVVETAAEEKDVSAPPVDSRAGIFEATSRQYAGQKMSFDFVDTDIRNILQLISEVAGINIVWGEDVGGKISMKLESVPWDQALEMILRPNGLTYQIEDDVLWVVPKEKLRDLEIKEGKRKGALMAAKRLQGIFEAKIVEFITIRHRKAADVFKMLVGDQTADPPIPPALDIEAAESEESEEGEEEKGKQVKISTMDLYLSYDSGTNVIIANGVRAKVDKVKELISKLDIPEKQVLIEARVVDASTTFARDLGIQWGSLERNEDGVPLRPGVKREWYNAGAMFTGGGQFSTNAPSQWTPNIGMAFGWLTDGGLGSLALDASLALAESDGKAHVISAPKVLTVNGQEARISRGETRYIGVRTQDTQEIEDKEATLSLTVTPTVSADNSHVTLNVVVTDDRPVEPTGNPNDYGGKTVKEIQSTLLVRTGETVVIGGIYAHREEQADTGFPWAKDIPVLGWLFKAERKVAEKHELLIFLTPTILNAPKTEGT